MQDKPSTEDAFRDSLKDVVAVAERLKLYYSTIEEFQESCQLAIDNEVHLKLLIGLITTKGKR